MHIWYRYIQYIGDNNPQLMDPLGVFVPEINGTTRALFQCKYAVVLVHDLGPSYRYNVNPHNIKDCLY